MPWVCWIEYSDHSGINEDGMMIVETQVEAIYYKMIVDKTCGGDIPHIKQVDISRRLYKK